MLAILLTILFFGFTITVHELGHFLVAKWSNIKVNEFSIGMGPSLFHFGKGETKYSLRLLPIGGYVSMEGENENSDDGRSFSKAPIHKRMAVILAGAFVNLVVGFIMVGTIVGMSGGVATTTVNSLANDVPDFYAIHPGDKITAINGYKPLCIGDFQFELSRVPYDKAINLTVDRDGSTVELNNVGYDRQVEDQRVRALGITLEKEPLNIGNFFTSTFGNGFFYAKLIWTSLGDLLTGAVNWTQLSGPVGVVQAVGQARANGAASVIGLFAFLSINVGIFNLLPFPALDGGQFIFLLIELIFRKPVKKEVQQYINITGLALVFLLFIIITVKDVSMLF